MFLVLVGHAKLPYLSGGGAPGVTLFFVLSGFLITRLLVEERQRTGRIDYRAFYIRRVRRLVPALVALVAATTTILILKQLPLWPQLTAVLYVSNIAGAIGLPLGLVGHTWSLSLEEQFYLLWPPLMLVAARTRQTPLILMAAAAASVTTRLFIWEATGNWNRVWYGPDTRADALLIGCVIGLTIHQTHTWRRWPAFAAASVLVLLVCAELASMGSVIWLLLPMALASAAVIGWAVTGTGSSPVRRALSSGPMQYLGRISYGLYLWHFPIMFIAIMVSPLNVWATAAITFPLSIAMAAASWRLIEQPLGKRRAAGRTAPAPDVVLSGRSGPLPF